MTDVVYARPVVVDKEGKAVTYGNVIDYSVVEYVETAKGSFNDGIPVIEDEEVISLLDSMLFFGATIQGLANNGYGYAPESYLANDELHKIWVTPVVAGTKLVRVFGGFFKYDEGGYATICEPFFDGYEPSVYKDASGKVLTDANPAAHEEALGFQIDAVDGDIEVTVEYSYVLHRQINSADYGTDFSISNLEQKVYGDVAIKNGAGNWSGWSAYMRKVSGDSTGGATINLGGQNGLSGSWFNSVKMVEDPSNPGNYLFQFTSSNAEQIAFTSQISPQGKTFFGYGDTLDKAVTFEVEIGKTSPDSNVTINGIYLRDNSTWAQWATNEAYDGASGTSTYKQGQLFSYLFRVLNNEVILPGNSAKICTLPDTGLLKVAVTIHDNGDLKVYYSDVDGEMICAGTWNAEEAMLMSASYKAKHEQYLANLADDNDDNNDDLLPYKDIGTYIEMSNFSINMYTGPQGANPTDYHSSTLNTRWPAEFATATVEIDGSTVSVQSGVDAEGKPVYNPIAMKAYMEKNYGFLMSTFTVYIGDVYGVNIADLYEVDDGTFISVTGEDFGEGFAISNLTSKIGIIDGDPAKLAAMGATYDDPTKVSLNAYRFEKLFRRVWFEGTIGSVLNESKGYVSLFQGFKTVADPADPDNLVLQITTGNRTTLDLEIIKPEQLANAGWGNGGAITLEFEIGQSNPNASISTRVFQLQKRADENPDKGFSGSKNISVFTITDNKVYFTGDNANADTSMFIGEIPTTGFAKVAFVIYDTGVIKAYFSDADGNMVYACEKDVSGYSGASALNGETFASYMNNVITTRWNMRDYIDETTVQAATVELNGETVPVYADGVYNEEALQVYMEANYSFLLDNFKVAGKALYE